LSNSKGGAAQPKYTLSAHDGAAAALDINPHIRGCIATGGMDKLVKIWNITDEETEGEKGRKREISLATSRDLGLVCLSHFTCVLGQNEADKVGQSLYHPILA
jgi:periodic tryptophan protein 1